MSANVLIGLGGSGAKTLKHLATTFAEDRRWQLRQGTDLYFLLIDTDSGDVRPYHRAIQNLLPQAHVDSVHLSSGYSRLSDVVDEWANEIKSMEVANPQEALAGYRRFTERWWVQRDSDRINWDELFVANRIQNIVDGAGQVPSVGFLLAWRRLQLVTNAFQRIFSEVKTRRGVAMNPGDRTFFVGSQAGGTGRGTAITLGFLYNKVFLQEDLASQLPPTYFISFDGSCFADDVKRADDRLSMAINSLTGWSELSTWHALFAQADGLMKANEVKQRIYRLPSIRRPNDPDSDAIHFDELNEGVVNAATRPFQTFAMIFRESDHTILKSAEDFYRMVATGLYVRLSENAVKSDESNHGQLFRSLGAATARIEERSIDAYYREKALNDAYRNLCHPQDPKTLEKEASTVCDELLDELLGYRTMTETLLSDQTGERGALRGRTAGAGILQVFLLRLMESPTGLVTESLKVLQEALMSDDEGKVRTAVNERFNVEELRRSRGFLEAIERSFIEAIDQYRDEFPDAIPGGSEKWAWLFIERLVGSDSSIAKDSVFGRTQSAKLVAKIAELMIERLQGISSDLALTSLEAYLDEELPSLEKAVEDAAASREHLWIFGKRFDQGEQTLLINHAKRALRLLGIEALGKSLAQEDGGLLGSVKTRLQTIARNANSIAGVAESLRSANDEEALRRKRRERFILRDSFGEIDQQELLNSLPPADDSTRFVFREIRPVEPDDSKLFLDFGDAESEIRILLENEGLETNRGGIQGSVLQGKIRQILQRHAEFYTPIIDDDGDRSKGRPSSLFEMEPVLIELYDAWERALTNRRNDDRFVELCDRFERFFGARPTLQGREVRMVSPYIESCGSSGPVLALAASLISTCRPFWKLVRKEDNAYPVRLVMLPIAPSSDASKGQWDAALSQSADLPIYSDEGSNEEGFVKPVYNYPVKDSYGRTVRYNPCQISVYVTDGCSDFARIRSLDEWKQNVTLRQILERFEDRSQIPPVFATATSNDSPREYRAPFEGYKGSGFSDRSYIRDPELRKLRWRPWYREASAEAEVSDFERDCLLALYAVWGARGFLEGLPSWQQIAGHLDGAGWPEASILSIGEKERIKFHRFPGYLEGGRFREAISGIGYTAGNEVEQSIDNLVDSLRGQRDPKHGSRESMASLKNAVEREFDDFMNRLGAEAGFSRGNPQGHLLMLRSLREKVAEEAKSIRNINDGDRKVYETILSHLDAMESSVNIHA